MTVALVVIGALGVIQLVFIANNLHEIASALKAQNHHYGIWTPAADTEDDDR